MKEVLDEVEIVKSKRKIFSLLSFVCGLIGILYLIMTIPSNWDSDTTTTTELIVYSSLRIFPAIGIIIFINFC